MSVELLYTSAVQGLKQGSRGFCTVISTAGMPINLATRLEGLSAYRHIYPPNHPDAAKNPVNFSHLRINVGGRPVSILSRVADYGIDYSQRTNKLAHHVVVEAHEQTPAGPAWLMQSTAILRSRWDGQCATPASGPTIPMQDQTGKICTTWKSLSGDAGWGGVVADTFASGVGKPLWIIYDLGQREQLLTLLNEAIALLPHEKRWSATFSTYATNVPPDADCKVRCVPAGSDDARLAPAMGKVIDLTKKQAVPTVTELVTAAREGIAFTPKPTPSAPRPMAVETHQANSTIREPDVNDFELVEDDFEMKLKPIGPPSVTSSHRPPSPPPTVRSRPAPQPNYAQLSPETPDSNSWMKWALVGASVAIVCLMIAIGGLVLSMKSKDVAVNETKPEEVSKSVTVESLDSADSKPNEGNVSPNEANNDGEPGNSSADENSPSPADNGMGVPSSVPPASIESSVTSTPNNQLAGAEPSSTDDIGRSVDIPQVSKRDAVAGPIASEGTPVMPAETQIKPENASKPSPNNSPEETFSIAWLPVDRLHERDRPFVVDLAVPLDENVEQLRFFARAEGTPPYTIDSISKLAVKDLTNKEIKSIKFTETPSAAIVVRILVNDKKLKELFEKIGESEKRLRGAVEKWNKSQFGFIYTVNVSAQLNVKPSFDAWSEDLKRLHDDMLKAKTQLELHKPYEDINSDLKSKFIAGFTEVTRAYAELTDSISKLQGEDLDSGDIVFVQKLSGEEEKKPLRLVYRIRFK